MDTEIRPSRVMTVMGPLAPEALGVTDAHSHVWISPVGAAPGLPALTDTESIALELVAYHAAGGGTIVDCQPGRAGRDAVMLRRLSARSGIAIVACTGFHLRKYYPAEDPLWSWSVDASADHFIRELQVGVEEALEDQPVQAGFIKVACEATLEGSPQSLLLGAAKAAVATGAALEVHTERGGAAEAIVQFLGNRGVQPRQIVICHIDKRPDFGLHRELAMTGVLLEYDTFYRPKYDPARGVWPLLDRMIGAGLEASVALATDMAQGELWRNMGDSPGMTGFLSLIQSRLLEMGVPAQKLAGLMGANIARRLVPHQPIV